MLAAATRLWLAPTGFALRGLEAQGCALPEATTQLLCAISSSSSSGQGAGGAGEGLHAAAAPLPPPPPPALPPQPTEHWLDQYFPGMRQWLEGQNRKWWIRGLVHARCKQYHPLEGREQVLRASIEERYQQLLGQYSSWVVDDRSETHLQVACLVLATHQALLPWLRDEREVLQILQEHMGGQTTSMLRFLMRAVKLMQRDGFATLSTRLRGLQLDYGAAFTTQLERGEQAASLTISSCFYQKLFEAEGQPQLAGCTCCSQDAVWLEGAQYAGVRAGREAAISAGDSHCCFRVERCGSAAGEPGAS